MTLHNTHSHSKVGGCSSKEKGHHTKKGSASRGTLSPRQKQDVLFAVRLVKNEGIEAMVHGIILRPLESSAMSLPTKQDGRKTHAASTQPLEPSGSSVPPPSKKQSKSDTRLQEFQKKKVASKWLHVTNKLLQMAAHCRGWEVKGTFLSCGLVIREKMLHFMRRVIVHYSLSRKRRKALATPLPVSSEQAALSLTPSTPLDQPRALYLDILAELDFSSEDDDQMEVEAGGRDDDRVAAEEERQLQLAIAESLESCCSPNPGVQTPPGARAAQPPAKRMAGRRVKRR